MKLNLGSGEVGLDGYENLDIKNGQSINPIAEIYCGSIEEVRASHVLEHFSHNRIQAVLEDWVDCLKPGGILKIAVPNFEWIAKNYLTGNNINVQGYTMGGQSDENDYHKVIFDPDVLTRIMRAVGLINIRPWTSETNDCASLPVSLNLMGTKRTPIDTKSMKVGAAMSVPRLGFMDNFFCGFSALLPLKIQIRKHTGAFWGQCIERCIDELIAEGKEWILTIDYDTIFTKENVLELLRIAKEHPEADAIAPLQASRSKATPLMTIKDDQGANKTEIHRDSFSEDITQLSTAHFGLTLLNVEKLKKMQRPLFWSQPGSTGKWDDERQDDDIYFWKQWEKAGNTLYLANRVAVGHLELMVRWPDTNMEAIYQHPSEFYKQGEPSEVWK